MESRLSDVFKDIFKISNGAQNISSENTESWDSLNHLNLILAIEEEFELDIPPDDFPALHKDFQTVLNYVMEKTS